MIRAFLFSGIFLFGAIGLTAQTYSINDPDGALTQKEKQYLEKAIIYEIDFFNKVFPDGAPIKISDVKVSVFDKYADYLIHEVERGKTVSCCMPSGYFNSQAKEVIIYKNKDRNDFLNVCYHELSHFFLSEKMKNPAAWLNEGLASYFESMDISAKAVKFKKHSRYLTQIKTLIAHKDVDIVDFITWNSTKFKKMVSYNNYSYVVSYCIVYLLMQKNEDILISMMRDMRDGKSSTAAFDLYYPGGLPQLERDFLVYFK